MNIRRPKTRQHEAVQTKFKEIDFSSGAMQIEPFSPESPMIQLRAKSSFGVQRIIPNPENKSPRFNRTAVLFPLLKDPVRIIVRDGVLNSYQNQPSSYRHKIQFFHQYRAMNMGLSPKSSRNQT